jgi:hypothetical protein
LEYKLLGLFKTGKSKDLHFKQNIMKFTKKCFCQKNEIEFYCDENLNEDAVDILYCPACSDRAPEDSLLVQVTGIPETLGIWGIKYNPAVLKEVDSEFEDSDAYYESLFRNGRCVFEKIWKKRKKPTYEIVGIKSGISKLKQEADLSGPDYLTIRKDGKPVKLPKKTRSSPEESYMPQSGYKGHK